MKELNRDKKRSVPNDVSLEFIPKSIQSLVEDNSGKTSKGAWECALFTAIRDEIKAGNLSVERGKRFGRFDDFFIPYTKWQGMREAFFRRAKLPSDPQAVPAYLTERLRSSRTHLVFHFHQKIPKRGRFNVY